jgi:CRISPR-associated protein Cas2
MGDPMWVMVMFDLPVLTKAQRKAANGYREMLYETGFSQVQFSVYAKYLINSTGMRSLLPGLKGNVPPAGEVRILRLTDEQWAGMYRYYGRTEVPPEATPTQMVLISDEEIASRAAVDPIGRSRGKRK